MSTTTYSFVRGEQQAVKVRTELTKLAMEGALTPERLRQSVLVIDEGIGDCNHYSVGGHWIDANTELFAQVVRDPDAFFRSCLDIKVFVQTLLVTQCTLATITDAAARKTFILDAYHLHGAINNDWVQVALDLGVEPDAISAAIRKRLELATTNFSPPHPRWDMNSFIRYGGQTLGGRATPWSVMTNGDLFQAWLTCCCVMPQEVNLMLWQVEKLDKLSQAQVELIRRAAFAHAKVMGAAIL